MKFFTYWARASTEDVDRNGKPARVSCWRWSDASRQDAHRAALDAARRMLARLLAGEPLDRYAYAERPMREEIKQQVTDDDGRLVAAVTQNAYGSLVLNAARVMFVDVDFPQVPPRRQLGHFLKKWFDEKARTPPELIEEQTREAIAEFVAQNPSWGARVYRTHSGLRLLATHELFDPTAESTAATLRSLSADPLYLRLCQAQQCFRARLTPKPWRCRHTQPFVPWPRENEDAARRFEAWQTDYVARQADFATCRYLETLGAATVHPEAQTVIDIHDPLTRSGESLALA